MRLLILFALLAFAGYPGKGQSIEKEVVKKYNAYWYENPKESAFLTTGQRIYYSGNSIDCGLSILDQYLFPSGISRIAYIELIHEKGRYGEKFVIQLEDGVGNTKINIPYDAPTGNYQLVAYTDFMKNFDTDLRFHRLPIYIQNPREEVSEVVKSISYPRTTKNAQSNFSNTSEILITNTESGMQVDLSVDEKGDYYLISEGFGSLQFIASVNMRKKGRVNFDLNQFKGSFQKLILVDGEMNVIAAKAFYFPSSEIVSSELNARTKKLTVKHPQNLLSKISVKSNSALTDSIDLFRRYYQLYYNIPPWIDLSLMSFEQLISNEQLARYSIYTAREWSQVLSNQETNNLSFNPEKELHLRGEIVGDLDKLDGCLLDIHFFKNEYEIQYLLDDSGKFDLSLIVPRGKDSFFTSILNEKGEDISKNYTIDFEEQELMEYANDVEVFPRAKTDSIISGDMDFNYVLSTFDESDKSLKTFWSDERIDMTFDPSDYRTLGDFEEFLREAVAAVTFVRRDGRKELRVFNKSIRKSFETSPVIVLNDVILSGCEPLLNLDLALVKSLKLINTNESLIGFGSSFRNGVLIVTTFEDTKFADGNRHRNFIDFSSYHVEQVINPVAERFKETQIMELNPTESFTGDLSGKEDSYQISIQSFSKDGTYQYKKQSLKLD